MSDPFVQDPATGIWQRDGGSGHRDDEYDSTLAPVLKKMQKDHFWYRGRRRFLVHAVRQRLRLYGNRTEPFRAVDYGGGCGGWAQWIHGRLPDQFPTVDLADSSRACLEQAEAPMRHVGQRYLVNVRDVPWSSHWDVAFLCDVLEHLPDDREVFRRIGRSLRPGGLLFVTVPALQFFWSYNDELVHHHRRYARRDLEQLAKESGLELIDARYFMFLLSPLVLLRRLRSRGMDRMSDEDRRQLIARTHAVPPAWVNVPMGLVFAAETPLGFLTRFPWGTSLLGVFRRADPNDFSRRLP